MTLPLRSTDLELQELRHRYNRLCGRFAEASGTDPASAAHLVEELQDLSDRIVAVEMRDETAGRDPGWPDRTDRAGPDRRSPSEKPLPSASDDPPGKVVALHMPREDGGSDRNNETGAGQGASASPEPSPAKAAAEPDSEDHALGAAVEDWLRRCGLTNESPALRDADPEPPRAATPPIPPDEVTGRTSGRAAEDRQVFDFDRLYDLIAAQEAQIGAVLRRCEGHQRQLEAVERRLAAQHPAELLPPQFEALGADLDRQRQRITALAIAIQRLLQWLAAERQRRRD